MLEFRRDEEDEWRLERKETLVGHERCTSNSASEQSRDTRTQRNQRRWLASLPPSPPPSSSALARCLAVGSLAPSSVSAAAGWHALLHARAARKPTETHRTPAALSPVRSPRVRPSIVPLRASPLVGGWPRQAGGQAARDRRTGRQAETQTKEDREEGRYIGWRWGHGSGVRAARSSQWSHPPSGSQSPGDRQENPTLRDRSSFVCRIAVPFSPPHADVCSLRR